MTCNDCIHNEVCEELEQKNGISKIFTCQCAFFKNKADFVEVVRCERCKYCKAIIDRDGNGSVYCDRTFSKFDVDPTDFCNFAERSDTE